MLNRNRYKTQQDDGSALIEVVVGAAIIAAVLIGTVAVFHYFLQSGLATTTKLQAAFLAEEGIEAARSIRDRSWSEFDALSGGTYHLAFGSNWQATSTEQLIDGTFTRTVTIEDAYRRTSDDDIVPESSLDPKAVDSETKRVSVTVSWGTTTETHAAFEDGTTDGNLASFPSNNAGDGDPAQSFTTPSEEVSVNEVALYMKRVSGTTPSDIFLELRETSVVGPVLATSQTLAADDLSAELAWETFTFSESVALDADTEYFLRLRSNPDSAEAFSGSSGTIHWGYQQTGPSPYAGGVARRYVGRQGDDDYQGQELAQYDFAFRVSTRGTGGEVEAVTYLTNLFE